MRTVTIIFKSLYACQHQCGFCHVLHVPRNTSYMSTEQVQATFDVIEQKYAGCRVDLDMSGGEFALRKDAVELIRYLRTKRIHFSSLVLDTMAVPLADEALAQALGSLFSKVNVSIHAPNAQIHAQVSASKTDFDDLRTGLIHAFRYFPAVFTNTSINKFNFDRLAEIAKFVLKARKASGRDVALYCAYYLPVYRAYGEPEKENSRRLQDVDNTQFLPPGQRLDEVALEFARARELLTLHGAHAEMRDFNYPACVYRAITRGYPENSFGLPNFMNEAYFTDYQHPMDRGYTLEEVYPSMYGRIKDERCADCVANAVCPGITSEWRKQGYAVQPLDEADYALAFPHLLLSKTLQSVLFDPMDLTAVLAEATCDWAQAQQLLYARLSNGAADVRQCRDNILSYSIAERASALCEIVRQLGDAKLAARLQDELGKLARIADEAQVSREPAVRIETRRLPLIM